MNIAEVCRIAPVIPVLIVRDVHSAGALAKALTAGGLRVLEVTLRTPDALDAIRAMIDAAPEAVVGAGTLLGPADVQAAKAAGAAFGVSPGATDRILNAAQDADLPMLPGVATPTEAMRAAERGLEVLKFFPAEANGGAEALASWASPLQRLRFCPTGGVTAQNAARYLALPNVLCVGGSWVAPADAVAAGDWARIVALAREAAGLGRG